MQAIRLGATHLAGSGLRLKVPLRELLWAVVKYREMLAAGCGGSFGAVGVKWLLRQLGSSRIGCASSVKCWRCLLQQRFHRLHAAFL